MDSPVRFGFGRLWAALAIAMMLFALTTSVALAATPEPTMGLTELQAKLDLSPTGTIQGHMKTVLRGSTIVDIDVDVLAITGSADQSLILFEANGPEIAKIGGIAAGMSGSPIYVDKSGIDTVIGAVSYGDVFTKGGTGLATPIDSMVALETTYPTSVPIILSSPVVTHSGVKTSVILTENPAAFKAAAKAGALVASPLSSLFVGGIDPRSNMFKSYATHMKTIGRTVVPLGSALSASGDFQTDFVPGASIAALATRGDLWIGGIGTVTRTNGNSVLAFGHPAFWTGTSYLYLANAWIDGVWPSTYEPYKLGSPGEVRGTVTQDRSAGILGQVGVMTAESPVTARARNTDNGRVANSSVYIPRPIINSSADDYYGLAPMAAYVAGEKLVDSWSVAGSALTTTTVVVNDGAHSYTLVRANIFDDSYSLDQAVTSDVDEMVSTFQGVNDGGLGHADIVSVDLKSDFTTKHREVSVADVSVAGGLHHGVNLVHVSLLQRGVATTRTVDVPITIPNNVPLTGTLSCSGPNDVPSSPVGLSASDILSWFISSDSYGPTFDTGATSVKSAVDMLKSEPTNNTLMVNFRPALAEAELANLDGRAPTFASVGATKLVDCVVSGYVTKAATQTKVHVLTRTVVYGRTGEIEGEISDIENDGIVDIYGTFAGNTAERRIGSTRVTSDGSLGHFSAELPGLTSNVKLRFVYRGDDTALASSATARISVSAYVALKASSTRFTYGSTITVTTATFPRSAAGKVVFERYIGARRWAVITSRTLTKGVASMKYKAPLGTVKIRARYLGGTINTAGTSRIVTIKTRR